MTTIRQVGALSDDEKRSLFGWALDPFGVAKLGLAWRPKDLHFLLEVDQQLVSHVGILKHALRAGTRSVTLVGFGGVVTVPRAQGQGHASTLIKRATDLAFDDWCVDAGLLFCLPRMVPYYERRGWSTLELGVIVDQPSGRIPAPLPAMIYPSDRRAWFEGAFELGSAPW
jgi:GNAT superfamily N-acetyltransferase